MSLGALAFLNPWLLAGLAALPIIYWLLRTVPPAVTRGSLFDADAPGALGLIARRVGWALAGLNDPDAGLVSVVARRDR